MGYVFRLLFKSSSGPQNIHPDVQTFTALWDPKRLQNKMYTLYKYIKYQCFNILYIFIMYTSYSMSAGDPTMQKIFVRLDLYLEGLKMTRIGVETCSP